MTYKRSLLISLILTLAAAGVSVWLYPHLPEPRMRLAFLTPAIMAFTLVGLVVTPWVSPHGFRMDRFLDVFWVIGSGIIAVLAFLHTVTLLQAAGHALPVAGLVFVTIGLLMFFIGNYMGKLRKNFFIGVLTPWTLASDEVWVRTHRLTGWVFAAAGIAIIADGLLGANAPLFIAAITCAVLTPLVYSFVTYWRIEGFGPDPSA